MSNERMRGSEEEFIYNDAWGILKGVIDFMEIKKAVPKFAPKVAKAIEVIRSNRPEYRKVFIKGLDDASVDNPQ